MMMLKSCFGCCSLRTGCILIGLFISFLHGCDLYVRGSTAFLIIGIPLAAILIFGAVCRNRICLWIWIVGNFLMIVLVCSKFIVSLLESSVRTKAHVPDARRIDFKTTYFVFVIVVLIIIILSLVLFTFVAYSYICELCRMKENKYNNKSSKTDGNGNDALAEANNLVPICELSVRFENKLDEMFNSK